MTDNNTLEENVKRLVFDLYQNVSHPLPFHGWHHVEFVRKHAVRFAPELGADPFLVSLAAYVHDLNYVAKANSTTEQGQNLRETILHESGLDQRTIETIEKIVYEGDLFNRGNLDPCAEAKALSDGDTLFKSLPITSVLLTRSFIQETGRSLEKLAQGIVERQRPLMEKGVYFYSDSAKKYLSWAQTNLMLWQNVADYLSMPELHVDLSHDDALKLIL